MTIDSRWVKKDFKQKYFLYCQDCKTELILKRFGQLENKDYIHRIKIEKI